MSVANGDRFRAESAQLEPIASMLVELYTRSNAMWISKAILISLAAAGCAAAQIASGAFQRLPPMPVQTPVYIKKTPTAKAVVVGTHPAQKQQCAIPLLNVTLDSKTH